MDYEIADLLDITTHDLFSARKDVCFSSLLSLDEMICREDDNRQVPRVETVENHENSDVLEGMELSELKTHMMLSISSLTEQERLVISLYYYEELTLKEIGEIMLISESRVSQIHTRAVGRLRGLIRDKFAI